MVFTPEMDSDVLTALRSQMDKLQELRKILVERRRQLLQGAEDATAIIVEPRKHRALSFVVRNVLENLDSYWRVVIHHGTQNKDFVENLLETELRDFRERISLENLGVDNLPTAKAYSEILMSAEFTEKIPTETFLVFQTDSMINPRNKNLIKKFMQYDYVGAPWPWLSVGNGGFSLRKKSKMLEIIRSPNISSKLEHEDHLFSFGSQTVKPKKPNFFEALEFSVETVYFPRSFGVHKVWQHLPKRIEELKRDCPGLDTLISLQGVFE
jgi:Protein of unknown function (DUF5672)